MLFKSSAATRAAGTMLNSGGSIQELKKAKPERLEQVMEEVAMLLEDEALAILENPYVTPRMLSQIAQSHRLAAYYNVRLKLVAHRQTPQAHAVKFVHYLYWFDLLRLSTDVRVPAPVRRAIDTQLVNRLEKLSLGERISSARRCGTTLIRAFLFDPHPRVFESLLVNPRLREDDLLLLASSDRATHEQLRMLGDDPKWSYRYAIRKALVLNAQTPRAVAASQLKYLSKRDLRQLHANPDLSLFLRKCIERLQQTPPSG
ncbi:MAG TPA: hypothetical protein VHW00_16535 [Thermoanaerobaculia bacterium]|nr:hypothetical protein [Thermoanaerobaculia bacterium]